MATSCSFTIIVNDSHPPRLTCPADIIRLSETPGDVITWDEPFPDDNSGQAVHLSSNHRPGVRFSRYGVYTVKYTAVDVAGNRATCDFSISIESPAASCDERDLPTVRDGRFRGCRTTAGVTTCTLKCESEFRPTLSGLDCLPSGRWDSSQVLSCLSNQLPVQVSTSMSFTFNNAPCRDNDDFANVVQTQLRASFAKTGICHVAAQNGVALCDDNLSQVITSSCQSLSSPRKQRDVTDSDIPSIQKTANSDLKLEKYNKRHPRSADELLITSPQSTTWLHKIPNNKMYTSTDDAEEKLTEIETMAYTYGDVLPVRRGSDVRRGRDVSGIDVTVQATVSPVSARDTVCSLEQRLNAVTQIVKEKVAAWSIFIDIEGNSHTVDSNSFSSAGVTHRYADGRTSFGKKCVEDSGWRKTVGIVVPCALLAIVVCIAFACLSRRKNKRQQQQRWDPRFTDLHTRSNPSFNPYDGDPVYEEIPRMVDGTKQSKGDGLRVNLSPLSRKENFYSVEPTERKQRPYASGGPYASDDFKHPAPSLKSYSSRGYSPNPTANAPLPRNPALDKARRPSLASQSSGKYSTRSDVSTVYEHMSDFESTFTVSKMAPSVGKKSSDNGSCDVYSVKFGKSVRSSRF
ncbi:SVEP1 [Branchiostoma lanceolatum]|uniref:SVEP1 protein n=1 Tax=Branchiostoma lanceolatum TaxID=7740 RepID=A0A8J9YZB0_BRALA|nr:SVEP1 [Branchiostoma lanceolatum]